MSRRRCCSRHTHNRQGTPRAISRIPEVIEKWRTRQDSNLRPLPSEGMFWECAKEKNQSFSITYAFAHYPFLVRLYLAWLWICGRCGNKWQRKVCHPHCHCTRLQRQGWISKPRPQHATSVGCSPPCRREINIARPRRIKRAFLWMFLRSSSVSVCFCKQRNDQLLPVIGNSSSPDHMKGFADGRIDSHERGQNWQSLEQPNRRPQSRGGGQSIH